MLNAKLFAFLNISYAPVFEIRSFFDFSIYHSCREYPQTPLAVEHIHKDLQKAYENLFLIFDKLIFVPRRKLTFETLIYNSEKQDNFANLLKINKITLRKKAFILP